MNPITNTSRLNGRCVLVTGAGGYRPLELDLHRPVADRPLPAVVYLHGGGWRQGARDLSSPAFRDWNPGLLTRLAAAGFAVVAPDYRLSGEARFPAQLEDVHRALDGLPPTAPVMALTRAASCCGATPRAGTWRPWRL
jgi:acetyl esterase/lipase